MEDRERKEKTDAPVSREPEAKSSKAREAAQDEQLRQEDPAEARERDSLQNYLNAGGLSS
jgi:hypothetical protein